jgi:hypothetical protein
MKDLRRLRADTEFQKKCLFYPYIYATPEGIDGAVVDAASRLTKEQSEEFYRLTFARDEAMVRRSDVILYNHDHPEKSLLLMAPLAKAAGGYATASVEEAQAGTHRGHPIVFATSDDPDYQTILQSIAQWPAIDYRPMGLNRCTIAANRRLDLYDEDDKETPRNAHTHQDAYFMKIRPWSFVQE